MLFFELIATADRTETKPIITYKTNGQDVHVVNRNLINLAELYKDDSFSGFYADVIESDIIDIYKDFSPCLKISSIFGDVKAEALKRGLQHYNQRIQTYSDFEKDIAITIEEFGYIKNDTLLLLKLHNSTELVRKAQEVKDRIIKAEKEEEDKRIREEIAYKKQLEEQKKAEKENLKAEKLAFLQGFGDSKTVIQIERLYDILSKKYRYKIDNQSKILSRRDFIIELLTTGWEPERKEGVVSYYGSKWNRKQSKPKTEYLMGRQNESYTITKVEYDFALYSMNKTTI